MLNMDSATNALIHLAPRIDGRNPTVTSGPFYELLRWQPDSDAAREELSEQTEEAYSVALGYIQTVHQRISQKEPWQALGRIILAFPSLVPDVFVKLLEEGKPRALVMLAHLLTSTKKLDRTWWVFRGVAEYHVRGIARLVPVEWQSMMAWPLRVLERGVDSLV